VGAETTDAVISAIPSQLGGGKLGVVMTAVTVVWVMLGPKRTVAGEIEAL
jgi:hypothetical protein